MQIKEAIILAGGFGTRLKSAVPDLPKCMAPVNGQPFISYVIQYLKEQGIEKFIFALGYKSEFFASYLQAEQSTINYQLSTEQEPLGTGGAIKAACLKATERNIIISNGDTLFKANVNDISAFHFKAGADCTIALKPMQNFERYGVVELNEDCSIKKFKEKQFYADGLINGGLYAINTEHFLNEDLREKFSFEKDYLEKFYSKRKMFGVVRDAYFIDIGVPEDYTRAQLEII